MPFWSATKAALVFFWGLLKVWANIFIIPFVHSGTIWIIVPIWLSWFFAEFFQEKEGTSFGNAISNGVIPFWVGIDWIRQLTSQLTTLQTKFSLLVFGKYLLSAFILAYGLMVIIFGIKGKRFVRYFGRIREITYILVVLTPFMYGLIAPDYKYFLSILLFFPLFYGIIEIIDRMTPVPKILESDKGSSTKAPEASFDSMGQMNENLKFPPMR